MQGKVAIVTGGAKGIGRHAALTLAKAGAKVVLADADGERMHKTLGEIRKLRRRSSRRADRRARRKRRAPVGLRSGGPFRPDRCVDQRRRHRAAFQLGHTALAARALL